MIAAAMETVALRQRAAASKTTERALAPLFLPWSKCLKWSPVLGFEHLRGRSAKRTSAPVRKHSALIRPEEGQASN